MKKSYLLTLGLVAVSILVAISIQLRAQNEDTNKITTQSPNPSPSPSPAEIKKTADGTTLNSETGAYTDYREGIIAETQGTKVLFFHASWCPQCRALEKSIQSGQIPSNTTIFKVDYDSNQALRKTYGVTIQTTLVQIDDSGKELKKFVASDDPSLQAIVREIE